MGSWTMSSELPAPQEPFHLTEELLPALLGKLVRLVQERYIGTDADMDKTIEKAVHEVIKDAKARKDFEQFPIEEKKTVNETNNEANKANEDQGVKENGEMKEIEAKKEDDKKKKENEDTKEDTTA